ncbi:unnamed protein product, partial [Prorocentrum cordatum]
SLSGSRPPRAWALRGEAAAARHRARAPRALQHHHPPNHPNPTRRGRCSTARARRPRAGRGWPLPWRGPARAARTRLTGLRPRTCGPRSWPACRPACSRSCICGGLRWIAPDLESSCARAPVAVAADWALLAALMFSTLALGVCCFDKRNRAARVRTAVSVVVPAGFVSSLFKAAGIMLLHPLWCSWFESVWCMSFGLIILTRYVEASEVRRVVAKRAKGSDPAEAEAAVAVVIGKLRVTVLDGGSADDPERGECPTQCAICLSEWCPDDVTRTTPCSHTFHEDCLRAWLTRQMCSRGVQSCAVCRRDLRAPAPEAEDCDLPPRAEAL